jgi:8-oxo-dGTP pyrophosphatase MutT (NUDIX family)
VLLGRRSGHSRFMPGIYVFPGGRVGPEDRRPSGFAEPLPDQPPGLDRDTRRRLAVFARAALRETYEETGLLLGTVEVTSARPPNRGAGVAVWNAFAAVGLAPHFAGMRLVARAITPADSPVRFHNRFFFADGAAATGEIGGDGELEDIHWAPLESLPGLPMAAITLLVLEEALAHRAGASGPNRPAPLFRWIGSRQHPWDLRGVPNPRA